MFTFDEIFERIKLATNTRTQVEIANVLDIRQSSISDAKRRNSVPSDWYMKLFERFGLNPDWLKTGSGPMYLRTAQGYVPTDAPAGLQLKESMSKYSDPDAKCVVRPVHIAQGVDATDLVQVGRISLPQSFAEDGVLIIRNESTAFEPVIHKGAYVGFDTNCKRVVSGELYGVSLPYEGVTLRRIFLDEGANRFVLRTGNSEHPEQYMLIEQSMERIVGRLAFVLQRY
ncbi:helix-turn-helix domain-containing protein [Desulfovibrio litoralis]|uniref:Phage repressor protein C, contains Cro/C1-type HTH and peptisase s24 domains n=1 Tax=Desulfovibrio litoralis DSM 11393 TaxID=1121455 RepID=A0A1M7TKB5_9BACT|nr:helix-turn-helix domain-containing protein [Desulfovibrio litoralis]SHN71146.1 Phage repressor protein C, contains Cro/C1-type HTH and peptisase s24 domains [Desulfovibrio litoralis DSM 11393]